MLPSRGNKQTTSELNGKVVLVNLPLRMVSRSVRGIVAEVNLKPIKQVALLDFFLD